MSCLTDGILKARLDGELGEEEAKVVADHIAGCAACRAREESLAAYAGEVRRALGALEPGPGPSLPDARQALARFRAEHGAELFDAPRRGASSRWLAGILASRWRPAWAVLALLVLVAALLIMPGGTARSWAQRILAMLRVQKIAVVEINPQWLPGLDNDPARSAVAQAIGRFFSDSIVVTINPGEPEAAAGAEQASQLAGFPVRLPSARSDVPTVKVTGELAFHMTVDRDRLQALLDEAGRGDLSLPASLDGATIAVHIPKGSFAQYGNCPHGRQPGAATPPQGADLSSCLMLIEVPSPTVSVPPELDIAQLGQMALQFAGMSAQDAQAFSQTVDWTSTLVVPVPVRDASYQAVQVDDVQGTLITTLQRPHARSPAYTLLWIKNGIIYSLTGFGSADQAVPLADSLQ